MADYKILQVVPLVDINEQGRFVKIYRVRYSYKGLEDYIDVPESEYKAEKVRELIEKRIVEHEKLLK